MQPPFPAGNGDSPLSAAVRRFLIAQGVKEHNHASEIARIIHVDRSQSYRRLKGEVAWSHHDLRAIARHFKAPEDALLPAAEADPALARLGAVRAVLRIARLPAQGELVPGARLAPDQSSDLVAVPGPAGWEVYVAGDEPPGAERHAIDALTLRSQPLLQVAVLEDDPHASAALVEALRLQGILATPFASRDSLLAALPRHRFDAFVLDWLLPDGTAAGVVETIRHHRATLPIVVVTGALVGDADLEQSLQALSAHWNFSTLDKPVRPMNLANTVKQLVAVARRH